MRLELEETTDNCVGKEKGEDFQRGGAATETRVCDLMELMDSHCKQEENVSDSSESATACTLPYSPSDIIFITVS